jgi:hypothetical protein
MRVKTEVVFATQSDLRRATTESLGCGPHRLRAVKAQDVESVFEGLDTGLYIPHLPLAVVATTVTEVRGTLCVPHRRPCRIDTNRVSILHGVRSASDKNNMSGPPAEQYQLP